MAKKKYKNLILGARNGGLQETNKELQGEDEQCQAAKFSQPAKFRRL